MGEEWVKNATPWNIIPFTITNTAQAFELLLETDYLIKLSYYKIFNTTHLNTILKLKLRVIGIPTYQ